MNNNANSKFLIWVTGLSASGKSTISEAIFKELKKNSLKNIVLLDGEDLRDELSNYKYDTGNRNALGLQKAKIAMKYIKNGYHVIITGIAHHKNTRDEIRSMFLNYFEIYLKCSVEECAKRDYKGNYKKAFDGEIKNFIGVTEDYEESNPELVRDRRYSINDCVRILDIQIDKQLKNF